MSWSSNVSFHLHLEKNRAETIHIFSFISLTILLLQPNIMTKDSEEKYLIGELLLTVSKDFFSMIGMAGDMVVGRQVWHLSSS